LKGAACRTFLFFDFSIVQQVAVFSASLAIHLSPA
jgi:hypothetical protein